MTEARATSEGGAEAQEGMKQSEQQTQGPGQWAERATNATESGIRSQYTKENPKTGPRFG